jgi:hypothetical protein
METILCKALQKNFEADWEPPGIFYQLLYEDYDIDDIGDYAMDLDEPLFSICDSFDLILNVEN